MPKTLIVIAGPTAVGKTATAIAIAKNFGTVVISADARQFYAEMSIGTAKPSTEELNAVPHYFIGNKSVTEHYSAGDFEREATLLIQNLFKNHDVLILCGGSGLYIKALLYGLDDMPAAPLELREKLNERLKKEGLDALRNELLGLEPDAGTYLDLKNTQRVLRALEVNLHFGINFKEFRNNHSKTLPYNVIKIGLELPREILYKKINDRVLNMIDLGLINEVKTLHDFRHLNSLQTVGYSEIFQYLDNDISLEKAVESIQQNTRRYAKRQLTWFKNQDAFRWFSPYELDNILDFIKKSLP